MDRIEQTYTEIRDLYLNTLRTFAKKDFNWFQEYYQDLNILLKEYFKAAHTNYQDKTLDKDTKLIKLLDIKLKMIKEINFYKEI